MIIDSIANLGNYSKTFPKFEKILAFMKSNDVRTMDAGRHEIDGDQVYALVQSYESALKENKKLEAHRKYLDIQYVVSGEEVMGWVPVEGLEITEPYKEDKDIVFFGNGKEENEVKLVSGYFAIFLPEDGHRPGCCATAPAPVRKVVFKVKL